jgi:hypothetical protein
MRVIINGVVAGLAEHPRLAYLSQHQWKLDLISSHMIFAVTFSHRGTHVSRESHSQWIFEPRVSTPIIENC